MSSDSQPALLRATLSRLGHSVGLAPVLLTFTFAGQAVRNTVGWPGYVICAAALTAVVCWRLWQLRHDRRLRRLPLELIAFAAVCAASLIWSYYQWSTLLGLLAQWSAALGGLVLALTLSWDRLLESLARVLAFILVASIAFESFVSIVVRSRVPPLWSGIGPDSPGAFFWSENQLFDGGPIQGIVGNRNLLAFIALLALLVFGAGALRAPRGRQRWIAGLVLAAMTIALTRSATVIVIAVAVLIVVAAIVVIRGVPSAHRRLLLPAGGALIVLAMLTARLPNGPLALLGRTDMTGREDIWAAVTTLAAQRPLLGWGWVGYWAPWVYPFDGLIVIDGVEYLQAHNALLDVWLQTGVLGVAAAVLVAGFALVRGFRRAVTTTSRGSLPIGWLPLLLMTALVVQAMTESRLLIEGNWVLLVIVAVKLAIERTHPPAGRPVTEIGSLAARSST